MDWRKSTFSSNGGAACIEVAAPGAILVRDTTDRAGGTLRFTAEAWRAFLGGLR